MINYLFPIFMFGLVITGIVYLGVMEGSRQSARISRSRRLLRANQATSNPAQR